MNTKWLVAFGAIMAAAAAGCQDRARRAENEPASPAERSPAESQTTTSPGAATAQPVAATGLPPAVDPAAVSEITWKDLDIGLEPDTHFEPWMLNSRVKSLLNRRVRLKGYMHGGVYSAEKIRTFFLKCEVECPFGVGGQAHHHVEVELQGKLRTAYRTDPVIVEGVLSVRPFEGPEGTTWSLYHLAGTALK